MSKSILGKKVKDNVSGFTGIAISSCDYLFGCTRICVQPGVKKDGTHPESHWFDEPQLSVISKAKKAITEGRMKNMIKGGPKSDVPPTRDPN